MAMYIIKPWYGGKNQKTTTFSTTTLTISQGRQSVSTSGGSSSSGSNTRKLFNTIFQSYGSNYMSSSSRSYTNTRTSGGGGGQYPPSFVTTIYYTSRYSMATITIPVIRYIHAAYSTRTTQSFMSQASTAKSQRFSTAANYTTNFQSKSGGTSVYATITCRRATTTLRNDEYFPLCVTSNNLIALSVCSLMPQNATYQIAASEQLLADMVIDNVFNKDYRIFEGSGSVSFEDSNSNTSTFYIIYPGVFVKYSDPSQVQQTLYSNSKYILYEGTLSSTK